MFKDWITYTLNNFGLVMFILAIIIAIIDWPIQKILKRASGYEVFFRWIILLPLGITAIYAFIMHAFFPGTTAANIGWTNSPFQFEVAMANLGFGVIAIASFNASYGFRLATVIGSLFWLWGDAIGHLYQMIIHHNFAPGNAGSWFWMDIIVPLILLFLIKKLKYAKGYTPV